MPWLSAIFQSFIDDQCLNTSSISSESDELTPNQNDILMLQSKKRHYDQEVENLERQQKQTIERLEQEHTNRLRDEAKRIKAEQDKELSKFQNMLKNRKKEVRGRGSCGAVHVQCIKLLS